MQALVTTPGQAESTQVADVPDTRASEGEVLRWGSVRWVWTAPDRAAICVTLCMISSDMERRASTMKPSERKKTSLRPGRFVEDFIKLSSTLSVSLAATLLCELI